MEYRNPDLVAFLLSKCEHKEDGCIEPQRKKPRRSGYFDISYFGARMKAHRALYLAAYGEIKPGLFICHTCDNRRCVNPAHLLARTHEWNMADMVAKGRSNLGRRVNGGTDNPSAKLTEVQVAEMRKRAADGETKRSLAVVFGVSERHAGRVVDGLRWR